MRGQNFSKQNHRLSHISGMAMAGIRVSLPNTASINKVQNTASAQCLARFSYNINISHIPQHYYLELLRYPIILVKTGSRNNFISVLSHFSDLSHHYIRCHHSRIRRRRLHHHNNHHRNNILHHHRHHPCRFAAAAPLTALGFDL